MQKNIYKMTAEELDKENKNMKSQLKKLKIPKNIVKPSNNQTYSITNQLRPSNQNTYNISYSPLCKTKNIKANSPNYRIHNKINPSPSSNYSSNNTYITNTNNKNISNDSIANNYGRNKSTNKTNNALNNENKSTLEYKIVKKNKLIIPADEHININNLKLCQKHLLPKEKNYFVSEENFKKIADAINSKEIDIKNLQMLLDCAQEDLNNQDEKFNGLIKMNEITHNKNEELIKQNSDLKINFDDLSFQVNKINIVFNKVIQLVNYILDLLKQNSGLKDNSQIIKLINSKISELELGNLFEFINSQLNQNNLGSKFPNNNNNINLLINPNELNAENLCKEYKRKLYDAESIIDELYKLTDTKNNQNLTDIAKDILETKKRIQELNEMNTKLEHENSLLRLNYQNLVCEKDSGINQIPNEKFEQVNNQLNDALNNNKILTEQNQMLQKEIEDLTSEFKELINEYNSQKNNMDNYNNKINNFNNTIKEKDDIINELRRQLMDYNKRDRLNLPLSIGNYKNNKCDSIKLTENISNSDLNINDQNQNLNKSNDDIRNLDKKNKNKVNTKKKVKNYKNEILKRDGEINMLKNKIKSLQNEDNKFVFESDSEEVGVNGVAYIGDMFMYLYNQAKIIENMHGNFKAKKSNHIENSDFLESITSLNLN